jgi:hypothetical protein
LRANTLTTQRNKIEPGKNSRPGARGHVAFGPKSGLDLSSSENSG